MSYPKEISTSNLEIQWKDKYVSLSYLPLCLLMILVHVHANIYKNFWCVEMVNRLLPQSTKYTQENEEEDVNGVRYLKSTINTTQPTPQAGEWLQVEYGYYGDNLGVVSGNR